LIAREKEESWRELLDDVITKANKEILGRDQVTEWVADDERPKRGHDPQGENHHLRQAES
jgi:hypothetical protein